MTDEQHKIVEATPGRQSVKYADKLRQWRTEMRVMVGELLDSDDPDPALMLLQAIAMVKKTHSELASLGLDECDWPDDGDTPCPG